MNPELRQTLQSISRNLESANEAAQVNIYTFTQRYIDPCISGAKVCVLDCTAPCFPGRAEQQRRKRGRSRGRPELNFDFYDDWEEDDDAGNSLVGWGNDELDSLLAEGSRHNRGTGEPQKQSAMSYGSRGRSKRSPAHDPGEEDPTVIPSSSYLGFFERLPFKFGGKLRYKPSAADLQENLGGIKPIGSKEDTVADLCEDEGPAMKGHGRHRSATNASRSTLNSLSSRGDLIPSDEEADAVPLDDEFAVALERRVTTTTSEDQSSARSRSSRVPRVSRTSTRTLSSMSAKNSNSGRRINSMPSPKEEEAAAPPIPPPEELQKEEEQVKAEEESDVVLKRGIAQKLASERGLSSDDEYSGMVLSIALESKEQSDGKSAANSDIAKPDQT